MIEYSAEKKMNDSNERISITSSKFIFKWKKYQLHKRP